MLSYFIKRLLVAIPTLIGISLVCFFLVQLTPGGPVEQTIAQWRLAGTGGETGGGRSAQITEEQRQALIEYYGFDKPIHIRYLRWLGKLVCLDLGESYYYEDTVWALIKRCLPVSITLGFFSFLATYLVCIPLGILKAVRHNTRLDMASSAVIFFLYSIPSFALGIVLIVLFGGGSFWNVFPIEGLVSDNFSSLSFWGKVKDYIYHIVLPLTCYTIGSFASLTMLMKNSLLEQLKQDYITTARAKGLSEKLVVGRHALRNAFLPIANGLGQWIGLFFAGSLLIETIFGLRGIGRLSYDAIINRDYPVVLADIMLVSVLNITGNLLSDFLYVLIDPRIDYA
ncbi:MAG: ABC transporter permease subunit [Deltaproteobacteria bacterium]|nr:ABC transporter permease subunit [Deltaproteobacteria bacterium]